MNAVWSGWLQKLRSAERERNPTLGGVRPVACDSAEFKNTVCKHNSAKRLYWHLGNEGGGSIVAVQGEVFSLRRRHCGSKAAQTVERSKRDVKTRIFSAQTAEKIRHPASLNRAEVHSGAARKGRPPAGKKRIEKLNYMHMNPVKRGLVADAKLWAWSSYRFYQYGEKSACTPDTGPK
jgi:hypothetical protein